MTSFTKSARLLQCLNTCNWGNVRNVVQSIPNIFAKPRHFSNVVDTNQTEIFKKKDLNEFDAVFPDILNDLIDSVEIKEVGTRYSECLKYNVPKGKKNRGLAVVSSYKVLEKPERLTSDNIRLANILGWSVELYQAFLLLMDDVVDGSETRRGQPAWHKKEHIGLTAINDALLFENSTYYLITKYLRCHPSYVDFLELFQEVTRMTLIGQTMDTNIVNVSKMSMERFEQIACYKTAYYSYYLPVTLAMYLSNYIDPELCKKTKAILLDIGKFFQIQDDFLDCFGDPGKTGKIGTDIETGKCTWLAATALQKCTEAQKRIMEGNYGKADPENVKVVKNLYAELDIPKLFSEYEENSYQLITSRMQNLPEEIPRDVFHKLVAKIYKRTF